LSENGHSAIGSIAQMVGCRDRQFFAIYFISNFGAQSLSSILMK